MRLQPAPLLSFTLLGCVLLACDRGETRDAPGTLPASTVTVSAATASASSSAKPAAVTATTAAKAAATATAKPIAKVRDIKQISSELQKRCAPKEPAESNIEMKVQLSNTAECIRRKMNADLDAVLLPLKKSDEARFKALMSEQATWNRFAGVACGVEEELAWVDFDDGSRSDGTARGTSMLYCIERSHTERVLYARALAGKDPAPLAKHIEEQQKTGEAVRDWLADAKKRSVKWIITKPRDNGMGIEADWKGLSDSIGKVQEATPKLAASTCAGWPELAAALGGEAACLKKAELYYYAQANEAPGEGNHLSNNAHVMVAVRKRVCRMRSARIRVA